MANRLAGPYNVESVFRSVTIAGGTLAGTVSWDLNALHSDYSVGNIAVTDAIAAGVTVGPLVNMQEGSTVKIVLPNPGLDTWEWDAAYQWNGVENPAWESGKHMFYQVNMQNGVQYVNAVLEGGNPVSGGAIFDDPVPAAGGGTEVAGGNSGSTPTFIRGYSGNLTAAATTTIGGPASGTIARLQQYWGSVNPPNNQSFPLPYSHPDAAANNLGLFLNNTSVVTLTQGTTKQDASFTYEIWARYTKT